jgi:signal transduction histidine kinase
LRGSHDEFDRLAASVNAMLDRIQELMEDVRQVSTDIAHDLRTPLTRLRQRVELASRKATDVESLRLALDRTLRDVDGVLDTFGALLKIARIEASPPAGFAAVDLTEILATIVEVYAPAAEENRQDLTVRGDRELLMQLFANLLENATRHAGAGTRIEVLATRSGDRIEVTVADRGPGIPEAMRRRVFQRFFRLESSRTTPGNGLGLSLARAIAAFHQTSVELADNQPGLRASVSLCAAAP